MVGLIFFILNFEIKNFLLILRIYFLLKMDQFILMECKICNKTNESSIIGANTECVYCMSDVYCDRCGVKVKLFENLMIIRYGAYNLWQKYCIECCSHKIYELTCHNNKN
jgi:hypothetical protein